MELRAPKNGYVQNIWLSPGDAFNSGDALYDIASSYLINFDTLFNIWLMKGFYESVPREIDESALVDGANLWQTYSQLIFPLVRPVLVVVGISSFVGVFNEIVIASVLLRDKDGWTLMVGFWGYISENFARDRGIFAAGAVIGAVPALIIYLSLQDQIVRGSTHGSI